MRKFFFSFPLLAVIGLIALPANGQDPEGFGTGSGWFHVDCAYSNSAPDDPIVAPRGPGASHMHDFLGARVDAFSTNDSIRRVPTRCTRTNTPFSTSDRSAYWVPALTVDGQEVRPTRNATAGYAALVRQTGRIVPFPDDFRVIAGKSKGGPSESRGQRVFEWSCDKGSIDRGDTASFATCAEPGLTLRMKFPDCWNGVDSDSPDHVSHTAYSSQRAAGTNQRVCPSTHPVLVPQLQLTIRYDTAAGPTTRLASGDKSTSHADFMNGWDPDKLRGLVERCLNADHYCGGSDYPVPGHP